MIKLDKIKKNNDHISCKAFLEDCTTGIDLRYNINNDEFEPFSLPKGYEWCSSHIAHAKRYLRTLNDKEYIPKERIIMWY